MKKNGRHFSKRRFLLFFAFLFLSFGAGKADAQTSGEQVFRGNQAIKQLQNNGQFESLKKAFEDARKEDTAENPSDLVTQTGVFTASNGTLDDNFGRTVEVYGDFAFVGSPFAAGGKGAVYVFYRGSGNWVFEAELIAPDGAVGDNFGASLSSLGTIVAIGAPGRDSVSVGSNAGAVYVFNRPVSTLTWTFERLLVPSDASANDEFGFALSMVANDLMIGAPNSSGGNGAVYAFARTDISTADYTQRAKITANDGASGDRFGASVTMLFTADVFIGAPTDDIGANADQGSVYRFQRVGGNNYLQAEKFTASDGAAGDQFGYSLAGRGLQFTQIIGAWRDDIGGNVDQGSAYVLSRSSGTAWAFQTKLVASDGRATDRFGTSVDIYLDNPGEIGGTAIVGSPRSDAGAFPGTGSAYLFKRQDTIWTQQEKITALGGEADDEFGTSVSIGNNIILGGAPFARVSGTRQGITYIFSTTPGGSWSQTQNLGAGDANDLFGSSVALSGNTAIIGAPEDTVGTNTQQGSAYIFVFSNGAWSLQQQVFASDGAANEVFGTSVSISNDTAIVGAPFARVGANFGQGAAYVFVRSGTTWTLQQKLSSSSGATGDQFGYSVSIDGDLAVAGAPNALVNLRGAAYVFNRSGATWSQEAILTASDFGFMDNLGTSVAISGETVVAGAPKADIDVTSNQGAGYVFVRSGTMWSEQAKLTGSLASADALSGSSVAISGDTIVIGAPFDDVVANGDLGSAYVFLRSGTMWTQQARLTAPGGATNDQFGASVAIFGDRAIIGAPFNDANGNSNQGAAYLFSRTGTNWNQTQKLVDLNGAAEDRYGTSVAVYMDKILIGAPFSDATISTPLVPAATDQGAVSAFIFEPIAPTAANVSISGRVLTSDGRGLSNAIVLLTDANGDSRSTRTGSFGFYRFDDIEAGQTVVISVSSKHFQFQPQVVSINESLSDVDFVPINGKSLFK